ncbi:hypothetical protein AQUSIP_17880 [Aquicella siphonis]|uniref:Glycosyl hydrolase family 32 N-terminal domain-containing protein n=2 Tax=Aquicella siphonis TaxID=254247 RepID=A0A5E4PIT0_9COXI|nr:hypothetical protein AQUSIP_17880 [Aquicella siphonis]
MIPTPEIIDHKIRIYLSCCDENGVGRTGYIIVSAENPKEILEIGESPLVDVGMPGSFDDNGAICTSIVTLSNETKYLYYVGFELCTKIRYRLLTGLAVSDNNGLSFRKFKSTPVLERSNSELFFRCGPCVLQDEGKFKCWYVAGREWLQLENKMVPKYSIHYLESIDGIAWGDCGFECLPISRENEYGFGRPYVIKRDGIFKMFYSIRIKGKGYRLGYAESLDGTHWQRKDDELNLDVSSYGWDSEMICYSSVIDYENKTYLFYNGNDFGRTGLGYALLGD